jgi:uncharacterized protein YecT (DUF1311 family)
MRLIRLLLVSLSIVSLAWVGDARAASFDCNRAATPVERAICADGKLSELDFRLGLSYWDKTTQLGPRSVDLLRQSQRSWLKYINIVCPAKAKLNSGSHGNSLNDCLAEEYERRLSELAQGGLPFGPFRVFQIVLYRITKSSDAGDQTGHVPGYYFSLTSYPQIDHPVSRAELTWNNMIRSKAEARTCGARCSDEDWQSEYEIGWAASNFISVAFRSYVYSHHAAHGNQETVVENMVMAGDGRPMTFADEFKTDAQSREGLSNLLFNKLAWLAPDQREEARMKAMLLEPSRWAFTQAGIELVFSSYEGGCYVCTPHRTLVEWSKLKPFVALNAVVAPP